MRKVQRDKRACARERERDRERERERERGMSVCEGDWRVRRDKKRSRKRGLPDWVVESTSVLLRLSVCNFSVLTPLSRLLKGIRDDLDDLCKEQNLLHTPEYTILVFLVFSICPGIDCLCFLIALLLQVLRSTRTTAANDRGTDNANPT